MIARPITLRRPVDHVDLRPRVHVGTVEWVDGRFSRRIGEQVADAHYACAIERPHPLRVRRLQTLVGWFGLIALLAVSLAVSLSM